MIRIMEKSAWRGFGDFGLAVFWRFYEERGLQTAGSLTYTTLLSLVPLFTVALADPKTASLASGLLVPNMRSSTWKSAKFTTPS